MNKKGGMSTDKIIMIFLLVVVVAIVGYMAIGVKQPGITIPPVTPPGELAPPVEGVSTCPSDGTTNGQARVREKLTSEGGLSSSLSYVAANPVYFIPAGNNPGDAWVTSGATSGSSFSSAVDLTCGKTYKWLLMSNKSQIGTSGYQSAEGAVFTASGDSVKFDVITKKIRPLQIRVKDLTNSTYLTIGATDVFTTSYTAINDTSVSTVNITGGGLVIGSDGYIDLSIETKTTDTGAQFGEDNLDKYMCVDSSTTCWQEPLVTFAGGSRLSNVKTSLPIEAAKVLSGYEYCYSLPGISETVSTIAYYQKAESQINPGTTTGCASADAGVQYPRLRFFAVGKFKSLDLSDTIKTDAFMDDTANTEVLFNSPQAITLTVG